MVFGAFKKFARTANFATPASKIITEITGIKIDSAQSYIMDYMDLFSPLIENDVKPANYLWSKTFEGVPHSSPLLARYDLGIRRKYDPMAISYFILKQDPENFSELTDKIEELMKAGRT